MMDGSLLDYTDTTQAAAQQLRPLIADNFAGGGGASTGIEIALGRSPDNFAGIEPGQPAADQSKGRRCCTTL